MNTPRLNQWIEIDSSRLAANIASFRRRVGPDVLLAPVVKSNGYGHGLERASRAFVAGGANWLCVHSLSEAQRVAKLGLDVTVLVLGPLTSSEMQAAVDLGLHVTVSSVEAMREVQLAARGALPAFVHLKIETGTHRQGLQPDALGQVLDLIQEDEQLELVGVHSHFANIEDTTRHDFATRQLQRYEEVLAEIESRGLRPRIRHFASSAAAILFPHTHFDLVRPGIAAYGHWPSRETLVTAREKGIGDFDLQAALTWKSRLSEVKIVEAGGYIGYGCTEKVELDTRIGVVPVGYADGYRRQMGGRAHVLVQGRRCRVRGRICMNLLMVDLAHVAGAAVGDEVVLLGQQGSEEIAVEELADWAQTIHYEVLAGLSAEIPRLGTGGIAD